MGFLVKKKDQQESDLEFIERLLDEEHYRMYRVIYSKIYNRDDASSVFQEVSFALFKQISTVRKVPPDKLHAYIDSMCVKKSIDFNRVEVRRRNRFRNLDKLPEMAPSPDPHEEVEQLDQVERIRMAISELPPHISQAMYLRYFIKLSDEEIAQKMGIKADNVRKYISEGRARLKALRKEGKL